MSRIHEALTRAKTTSVAAATGQLADPRADRSLRSALDHYQREDDLQPAVAAVDPAGGRPLHHHRPQEIVVTPRFSDAYQTRLVTAPEVPGPAVEQYRRLAATLHHLQAEQGLARLVVSSAVPREGKTLTSVNLAMTLSESYRRRVLLIDADLRRPSIHEVFGISRTRGFSDALRPDRFVFSRVSHNLWVLPAGSESPNPMTTLASRQLERFLEDVTARFDWILLDAPPVGAAADAGLLARLTRAVVFVIAAGSTPYALVEKAVAELGREHIVGTVLNRAEASAGHWSEYYDGYGAYGAYGSDSPESSVDVSPAGQEATSAAGRQKLQQLDV